MKGKRIPHLISARTVDMGGRRHALWEFRDITERKDQETALREG